MVDYGGSGEKIEEAVKATEFPGIASVQIIFNIFRQRPKELFFPLAQKRDVGILVRLPLASGLLGGKINRNAEDRKSTRLNSSHQIISYAVFCLKKKKK